MFRLSIISLLAIIGSITANAGSIQIGGASGLTSNYITQGAGAACAAGPGNCVAGSTNGWAERNYDTNLFAGSVSTVPYTGYVQNGGEPTGLSATDNSNGATFSMLADGASATSPNPSNNFWESTSTGGTAQSIVIPIGIFGVTDLWTMLDNQWGTLGGNDTTITFNFGSTSNASSTTPVVVALNDSNNSGSGELRASTACTAVPTATCNSSTNPRGPLQEGVVINGVTVNEGVVGNPSNYTSTSAGGFYTRSQGTVQLDDQQFVFGSEYLNEWLVSVTVTENVGNLPSSGDPSETALSAITVDTVPEPASILLFLTGLGGVGLARFRRN